MWAGCWSWPMTGSSYAVPGAATRAQRLALEHDFAAQQPVGARGVLLATVVLLAHHAEDVEERLKHRAGLTGVLEPGAREHAVAQLARDDVERREPAEDLVVTVAGHDARAVPEA